MSRTRQNTRPSSDGPYPSVHCVDNIIDVAIPDWISSMLFNELEANHNPAKSKRTFDNNLDSPRDGVMTYLGTYFPRSLAESFVLFDSLFSDKKYLKCLSERDNVSILSVGSGTGGDLMGLLLALSKNFPSCKGLDIISLEGNSIAHEVMRDVLALSKSKISIPFKVNAIDTVFVGPKPFSSIRDLLPNNSLPFDFIINSKMLNELYSAGVSETPYMEFCEVLAPLLSETGVLLALDVTSPIGSSRKWTPILLNGQVNSFLRNHESFKTILPLLCNRFEESCSQKCYTQNQIRVTHKNITNECSKICYRVVGRADFVDHLSGSPALWDCPVTKNNMNHCDAFLNAR